MAGRCSSLTEGRSFAEGDILAGVGHRSRSVAVVRRSHHRGVAVRDSKTCLANTWVRSRGLVGCCGA